MNAITTVAIGLNVAKAVIEATELFANGAITEEELKDRWAQVGVGFEYAADLWKRKHTSQS